MKIAIMQPYFVPYLGYFSLIKHTDKFILFDSVQFIRHGWIERNRILKPNEGWQYIQVPLIKASRETLIKDMLINNSSNWQKKILAQLEHYKKKSPYYFQTIQVLQNIFDDNNIYNDITSLNKVCLENICKYLGISANFEIFSRMNLPIQHANAPDEWALNICKAMGNIDEYWNPIGGVSFFDKSKYTNNNIVLKFHQSRLNPYNQKRSFFEQGLSILDVMMFNSPAEINKMLDDYELL